MHVWPNIGESDYVPVSFIILAPCLPALLVNLLCPRLRPNTMTASRAEPSKTAELHTLPQVLPSRCVARGLGMARSSSSPALLPPPPYPAPKVGIW